MTIPWILLTLGCGSFKQTAQDDAERTYEASDSAVDPLVENSDNWLTGLQAVNEEGSSSSIQLRWNPPVDSNLQHYQLRFIDTISNTSREILIEATEQSTLLTGLKSQTEYEIELAACLDEACSTKISSEYNQITAATATEQWQLQGTGHSLDDLERIFTGESLIPQPYKPISGAAEIELYLLSNEHQIWKRGLQSNEDTSLDMAAVVDLEVFSCMQPDCELTDVSAFQVLPTSEDEEQSQLIVLASIASTAPVLYSIEGYSNQSSCQLYNDCQLDILFATTQLQISNFQLYQGDTNVPPFLLLEGSSDCSGESGFFLSSQTENDWEITMDVSGCPRQLIPNGETPSLLKEEEYFKLYFRQNGQLHFLYAQATEELSFASWEPPEVLRSPIFQWPDGGTVSVDDLAQLEAMKVLFSDTKYIFFQLPSSDNQSAGIGFASLLNP